VNDCDFQRHEKTCNGGASTKRNLEEADDDSPGKKQKLSDEELIDFEVFT
jgi:hypothetical protein